MESDLPFLFLLLSLHSISFSDIISFFHFKFLKIIQSDRLTFHCGIPDRPVSLGKLAALHYRETLRTSNSVGYIISGLYTTLRSFHIWKMIRLKMMYLYTCLLYSTINLMIISIWCEVTGGYSTVSESCTQAKLAHELQWFLCHPQTSTDFRSDPRDRELSTFLSLLFHFCFVGPSCCHPHDYGNHHTIPLICHWHIINIPFIPLIMDIPLPSSHPVDHFPGLAWTRCSPPCMWPSWRGPASPRRRIPPSCSGWRSQVTAGHGGWRIPQQKWWFNADIIGI